ncbi:alpha/beta fold hydrolase [soil metagenome]
MTKQYPLPDLVRRLIEAGQRIAAAFMLAAALAACSGQNSTDTVAALETCRLHGYDHALKCGSIDRAENPTEPNGRRLSIGFVVIPAQARNKLPDPVFVFAGGPGQSATEVAAQVMPLFESLNRRRDVVFVDQRGTGRSHALDCPVARDLPLADALEPTTQIERLRQCWHDLDADTRFYTTEIAMRDIDAVRSRLAYEHVNLWGGSYGTRAALDFLRQFPTHVRSVVLDGVAPPAMALPATMGADATAALRHHSEACRADEACRAAYPMFANDVIGWLGGLPERAEPTAVVDPVTGRPDRVRPSRDTVLGAARAPLYSASLAAVLPVALQRAGEGDFDALGALSGALSSGTEDQFSSGMHLAVVCAEDMPQLSRAGAEIEAIRATPFGVHFIDAYRRMCDGWPVGTPSEAFYTVPHSDAPVLVLSGGLDPVTPPRHGEAVTYALGNARHLIAPNVGHGVSGAGCGPDIVERFIRDAGSAAIDGHCLELIPRAPFILPIDDRGHRPEMPR